MPMKLTVEHFTSDPERIEVEIPDKCPHCDSDLCESGSLIELGFTATESDCSLYKEDGETDLDFTGSSVTFFEEQIAVGYECRACGEMVVGQRNLCVKPEKEEQSTQ